MYNIKRTKMCMRKSSISLSLDDLIDIKVFSFDNKVICELDRNKIYVGNKNEAINNSSYLIGYHLGKLDLLMGDYESLLIKMNEFKSIFHPILLININGSKFKMMNLSKKLIYVEYKSKETKEKFELY